MSIKHALAAIVLIIRITKPVAGGFALMRKSLAAVCILLATAPAIGADYRAQWVKSGNATINCFHAKRGWVFDTSGPCKNFVLPESIRVGESFQVDGKKIPINVIFMTIHEQAIPPTGTTSGISVGSFSCTAASSPTQIPSFSQKTDHWPTGIWLYIEQCQPAN